MTRIPCPAGVARLLAGAICVVAVHALTAPAFAQPATADAATATEPPPAKRPKIGLVLSGGGARGLAHVGVLKVLEELRVPVDFVTATSMGSIVGGLYVSGMSATRMEELVTSVDWPAPFSDQPPRRELSIRRKKDDAVYTIPLEIGFRDFSFRLSTGALTGQNLELLLHGLTWRDDDIGSFDNLPVDLVKAMGADVVIAVNIGTPLMRCEQLSSFIGIAEQSINILTEQNVRAPCTCTAWAACP